MDEELQKIIIRVLCLPLGVIIAIIVLTLRKMSLKDYFGLKFPSKREFLFWLLWFIPLIIAAEIWFFGFGLNEGRIWKYTMMVSIVRAFGVIILAPICEELIFRGVLFKAVSKSRAGSIGAVIITSVIFTAAHYQYGILDLVTIFVDALYWGWVRHKTGSVIIPIILHMLANTISVIEFIWLNKIL
jgi:membrane protease YdiL (CAAX protease family)